MLSPCSPSIMAETCVGGTFKWLARMPRSRVVSSIVPSPKIRCGPCGSSFTARYVSTSTGFETTNTNASLRRSFARRSARIFRNSSTLRLIKSRRLSSGLRRSPAVITTMSDPAICSIPPPVIVWSATSEEPCIKSSACPSASSRFTSTSAISRTMRPACSAKPAHEPTSPPPPIIATFIGVDVSRRVGQARASERRPTVGNHGGPAARSGPCPTLRRSSISVECLQNLVSDRLHQPVEVRDIATSSSATGRPLRGEISGIARSRLERVRLGERFAVAVAERAVAAQVAVLDVKARIVEAQLLLQIEQFVRLLLREVVDATQLPREQQNPAVGVEDLGLPIRLFEVFAEAHGAVVLQDHAARPLKERQHGVGEFLPSGGFIRGNRNFAHEDFDLGQNALRDRLARDGKRGRVRRMTVHHRLDVGARLH